MKMVSKLSFIALAILLAGCNEKVSPELQEGNSTTPKDSSTPVAPEEYYFNVTNISDAMLNYKVHKTGAGNATKKCEVRNTTGFSSDIFRGNPAENDITCYWEAEELTMFHSGWELEIQASKNTCDYVAYSPFSFYDSIPGDSSATYWEMTCATEETNSSHVSSEAGLRGINIQDNSGNDVLCGDAIIDENIIPAGTRNKFQISSDEDLCAFNYPGASCDIGIIRINELVVTHTPATDTEPASTKSEVIPRVISCGGAITNCVAGPVKDLSTEAATFIEVTNSNLNQEFRKEYKYDSVMGERGSIKKFANFRRNLASKNIDFVTSDPSNSLVFGTYKSTWSDPLFGKQFDPQVVDSYSSNLMLDNLTPLVDSATLLAESVKDNTFRRVPLAADPYLGLAARVNPFYTFYCLDTALDIKARIRMVVREWDRVYPSTSSDLELLSDLYKGTSSRQDAPFYVELPDDNDTLIYMNDIGDWDDKIPMERSAGTFDPFATIWRPVPTASYPDGWFNPSYFTNGGY